MIEPVFPNYPKTVVLPVPPTPTKVPQGIPFVDEKYHKPLYKMMKSMMKSGKKLGKMGKLSRGLKRPKKVKVM